MADPYKYQISGGKQSRHLFATDGQRWKVTTVRRFWRWPRVTTEEGNILVETLLDEAADTAGLTWEDVVMTRNKGGPTWNVTATQILVTKVLDPV